VEKRKVQHKHSKKTLKLFSCFSRRARREHANSGDQEELDRKAEQGQAEAKCARKLVRQARRTREPRDTGKAKRMREREHEQHAPPTSLQELARVESFLKPRPNQK
jgi:hypothetical protein